MTRPRNVGPFALFLTVVWLVSSSALGAEPRRVILFIGDGFGATQTSFGLDYGRLVLGKELTIEKLMNEGNTGLALPLSYESAVTDSAAAATQIATGRQVRNESVGLDPSGYPLETILEWAEARGLATGLVTNMRLSHATPASFAAHQISRYEPESKVLDEMLAHDIEVLLGGGGRALVPMGRRLSQTLPGVPDELDGSSNRSDEVDRLVEARGRGYEVVSGAASLAEAAARAKKLLGVFAASHMPYVVDRRHFALDDTPGLAAMTEAAIAVLEESSNGFFLMVEGGRIDYAGHENDAGSMIHEILDFDEAVTLGVAFQRRHPDTLVIVTADHGTGGFSFTYGDYGGMPETMELPSGLVYRPEHRYATPENLKRVGEQTASFLTMVELAGTSPEKMVEVVEHYTGFTLSLDEARAALVRDASGRAHTVDFTEFYGDTESNPACLLGRALARQTHVVWSTGGHTSDPVPTYGTGPSAERLRGVYTNTHLYDVMKDFLSGEP